MNASFSGWWHRALRRLGAAGVVAMGGLLGALLLAAWLPRLEHEGLALRAEFDARSARMARPAPVVVAPHVPMGQQIGAFVQTFPPLSQHAADLRQVFASAHQRNLLLPKGEYQIKDEVGAPLVAVTATFPVVASYPTLRDFSADVLKTLPHAALDELRMTRDGAGNAALASSVRFSFVYRRP